VRKLCGRIALVALVALVLPSCSDPSGGKRTAVASFYPLAYAAERISGSDWEVIDLTPPGTEAHDVELSLEDRAAIQDADLMIHLGDIGFQPQVEEAAKDSEGRVLTLADKLIHHPEGQELEEGIDPHIWLNPGSMRTMASLVANAFIAEDPDGRAGYLARADRLRAELERLDQRYRDVLNIRQCRYGTLVVSHEAFNYMAGRYAFRQYGLAGLTPEGEPTTARLAEAERLIEEGQAGAVFYEAGGESQRAAEALGSDAGVPALPLSTLESEPPEGDYLSVMEDNLDSLRQGLGCP
jgi:zinc transport system substrate-binding protein